MMTDKDQLDNISIRLLGSARYTDNRDGNWLRDYIARTWPEKKKPEYTATPENKCLTCGSAWADGHCMLHDPAQCHMYSRWTPRTENKPPTAACSILPPGYRLQTDGKTFRIVTHLLTVLAHTRTKEAAIGTALGHAAAETQWKEVEA